MQDKLIKASIPIRHHSSSYMDSYRTAAPLMNSNLVKAIACAMSSKTVMRAIQRWNWLKVAKDHPVAQMRGLFLIEKIHIKGILARAMLERRRPTSPQTWRGKEAYRELLGNASICTPQRTRDRITKARMMILSSLELPGCDWPGRRRGMPTWACIARTVLARVLGGHVVARAEDVVWTTVARPMTMPQNM